MKRLLFILYVTLAAVCSMQAGQVSETDARQVADSFFHQKSSRFTAQSGPAATQLVYTAESNRFYVYNHGGRGGFVIVAGDDRLPQVLGYGDKGDFTALSMPPAVRYWMDVMNRQIAYLQSHGDAVVHRPAMQETAVAPLLTTQWDQGAPYNNYCPTYDIPNGGTSRAVTGCVATAEAQVMNYYQWPPVGRGSHSYVCNVNDVTPTELTADYSQSVYRWDLMLDNYDESSPAESCDAVARLMSDVGISVDMGYGSSSGASEYAASQGLVRYFGYGNKCYWLDRDYYSAEEWDQFLYDELSQRRPVMYCGHAYDGGHAFVLDGFDNDGYIHVNWGWGGSYDGYFLVSFLAPTAGMNFQYIQDGLFGLVPETQVADVADVLYIRGGMVPVTQAAPLGTEVSVKIDQLLVQGNMLDTAGYDMRYNRKMYYALIPMSLGIFDKDGVERQSMQFNYKNYLSGWGSTGDQLNLSIPESLEDGEYKLKLAYSLDKGNHYDQSVSDYSGKETYVKLLVRNDTAYLSDCFLYNTYSLESMVVPRGITVDRPFNVQVKMSYEMPWGGSGDGPLGNVYLSILKDGQEVANSEMYEVMIPVNTDVTCDMQITAPSQWGVYDLVLKDESGNQMMRIEQWQGAEDVMATIFVLPICQELFEDFEGMTANNSTTDKNVEGNFITWSFNKSGVRAPGEGLCNGEHSVMMKKPSTIMTSQPLRHNFFMAQATFFNPSSTLAKYKLEYSVDGGSTWERAYTIDSLDVAEIPEKSQTLATWNLNLSSSQPAQFRIAMIGGGSGPTYVDDIVLYFIDQNGDVNGDGEINIADVNAVISAILTGEIRTAADVNGDGEVNIADVNAVITLILQG